MLTGKQQNIINRLFELDAKDVFTKVTTDKYLERTEFYGSKRYTLNSLDMVVSEEENVKIKKSIFHSIYNTFSLRKDKFITITVYPYIGNKQYFERLNYIIDKFQGSNVIFIFSNIYEQDELRLATKYLNSNNDFEEDFKEFENFITRALEHKMLELNRFIQWHRRFKFDVKFKNNKYNAFDKYILHTKERFLTLIEILNNFEDENLKRCLYNAFNYVSYYLKQSISYGLYFLLICNFYYDFKEDEYEKIIDMVKIGYFEIIPYTRVCEMNLELYIDRRIESYV